jgi:hypothetical protein
MSNSNDEFLEYIKDKIENGNGDEAEFDKSLLSLYEKGFVEVEMQDGEPFFQISEEGMVAMLNDISLSLTNAVEA